MSSIENQSTDGKVVVLVGPPNAGKTSLFNHLTGSRYKSVNYPGATVQYSLAKLRIQQSNEKVTTKTEECHTSERVTTVAAGTIQMMDTPGLVSLTPRSQDERVVLSALTSLNTILDVPYTSPHLLIALLDATQPARHLPLIKQVLESGIPTIVALTMNDIAKKNGKEIEPEMLSQLIGAPVIPVDGRSGKGKDELIAWIENYLPEHPATATIPLSYTSEKIQENFKWADEILQKIFPETASHNQNAKFKLGLLDSITLHPIFGLAVFAFVMSLFFWLVYWAAAPLMDLVDLLFQTIGSFAHHHLGEGFIAHLIVDGVIAGGGAVLIFVPQIAILFLALGVLEDSGYLARGAMLVDRILSTIGLNGKSFVPLLSGNACAIPAAMAARTIPGYRERILTLLVIPLMSCSARLPVWGLLLGFLVPMNKPWLAGIGLTSIYILSIVIASVVAFLGGKILRLPKSETGFQIELPQWRMPTLRTILVSTWDRTSSYVMRAGPTILTISVIFWLIMNLPNPENSIANMVGKWLSPILAPMGVDWRVGVALLAAFAAREVFVSALAIVYSVQADDGATTGILNAMHHATFDGTHQAVFTTSSILGLIIFFIIALQCLTTVAVMRREVSNKFALSQMTGFIALAWILSVLVVQGLRLMGVS